MRDLFTSQHQVYWEQLIQKEAASRVTWNIRYGHKYLKERARARARKQLPQAPLRSALISEPMFATGFPVSREVQMGQPETQGIQDLLFRAKSVQNTPPKGDRVRLSKGDPQDSAVQSRPEGVPMKQAPPGTRKLLFQGISHDGQGRVLYLRERYQQTPKEKYQYPILSSWEYGWHVEDVMKNSRVPAHAKVQPITKSFYTKNGIFYTPRRADQVM